MKNILFAVLLISAGQLASAQMPSQLLAEKIATRMKDSLGLTSTQKSQLYTINLAIIPQLNSVQRQYAGSSSLSTQLRQVEHTRDSLYSTVLTTEQFGLYRTKKKMLVYVH